MALAAGQPCRGPLAGWARRAVARLATIALTALLAINILYGFRGTGTALGSFTFTSPLLSGSPATTYGDLVGNRFDGTWLARFPVPLPRDFLIGFDSQLHDLQEARVANLSGGRLVIGGYWYSPLRTLLFKLPLGSLLLIGAAAIHGLRSGYKAGAGASVIWLPPLALIGVLCAHGGSMGFAYRYSLPALPFLLIAVGNLVRAAWGYRIGRIAIIACLLWNGVAVLAIRPSYLCFGNELVGGPIGAQKIFLGSNFDWGQDLLRLKRWADENPQARPLAVAYYGPMAPSEIGLPEDRVPASFHRHSTGSHEDDPYGAFYWAISSNALHGLPHIMVVSTDGRWDLRIIDSPYLRPENAIARAGYSIYIFRIEPRGAPSAGARLSADLLSGCIQEIGPKDLMATP